jgi:hypothetical protein
MPVYDFTLVLADQAEMTDAIAEALVGAGCDDGTPGSSGGDAFITMHREGNCLEGAIRSAVSDVQKAGLRVVRAVIETDSLVVSNS